MSPSVSCFPGLVDFLSSKTFRCSFQTCLNRMLYYECHFNTCPAGVKCLNQRFQKRQYPKQEPFRTGDDRGWGLKAKVDIKKVKH